MISEETKDSVRKALLEAIKAAGNQGELAARMSKCAGEVRKTPYKQQHISHWLQVGYLPPEHAGFVERAVGMPGLRHRLCPGVFEASEKAA